MKMIRGAWGAGLLGLFACGTMPSASLAAQVAQQPAPLRVFAAAAVTPVLTALGPQCQEAAGRPLAISYGTSVAIRQAVEAGDTYDVVILAADPMNALVKEGKARDSMYFAASTVAVGISPGTHIEVDTPDGVKQALLAAKAIAVVRNGAALPLVLKMADQLGVGDQVKAKLVMAENGVDAGALVTSGKADLVFNLMSELLPLKIQIAGPLPPQFDRSIGYAAAVPANAANAASAAALVQFLASPAVAPTLRAKGLDPMGQSGVLSGLPNANDDAASH